jgi:hypothetical protein
MTQDDVKRDPKDDLTSAGVRTCSTFRKGVIVKRDPKDNLTSAGVRTCSTFRTGVIETRIEI